YYGDKLQLQVNLCTKNSPSATCLGGVATDEQKQAVQDALDDNPEVKSFEVRSAADNYDRARQILTQSETGRKQLETLGPDAFPETYYVTLKNPDEFDGVVSQVSGMDGVGNVSSLRKLLGPLFEILEKMRWAALATSLLLIVAAILQVSNTIRMTAYARRREIGIMRLVGASSWHIQLPFVLESLIAALISAALAAGGLAAFMYFVVYGYLRDTLGQLTTWVRWQEAVSVMGWTTLLAVLLALVPTLVMTRKYLDV
ncbi:MAG: FtsX-like permease family protein, partial [Actinomycetales bacterium]